MLSIQVKQDKPLFCPSLSQALLFFEEMHHAYYYAIHIFAFLYCFTTSVCITKQCSLIHNIWNHAIYSGMSNLTFLLNMSLRFTLVTAVCEFSLLCGIPLCNYTTVCLSNFQFTDTGLFPVRGYLQRMFQWTFLYKSFGAHKYVFL